MDTSRTSAEKVPDDGPSDHGSAAAEPKGVVKHQQEQHDELHKGQPASSEFRESSVPPSRFYLLSLGVCMGLFLSVVDTSIVATSLYSIGVDFQSIESVNWVALSYTTAYLSCAVAFARLSDVVGRRNAFAAAYLIFFAFSLACGFANDLDQLIAFRALQGIGGSGLYSITMIILPEVCPKHLVSMIGSLIGLVIAGAGVLGPVLGGILTHYATWRWVFWINGPIGIVSMAIFLLAWPPSSQLVTLQRRSWKEFDYLGSFLVIAAAALVVFAFQNAGESPQGTWSTAVFIAPLVCGLLCWLALGAWEYLVEGRLHHRIAPAFPANLFRNRVYTAGALTTLFMGFPFLLLVYSFPLRAQIVSGKSALIGGLMLLPMLGTVAVGSIISGKLNAKKNFVFETILAGACLMTLSCGLLTIVDGPEDDAKALGFLTFAGLGFGLSTAGVTIMANFEAPIRDYAPAQGIIAQLRILGGSLGISMSTSLLNTQIREHLVGVLTPAQLQTLGRGGAGLTQDQASLVQLAYLQAFQKGMIAAVAVAGTSVIITLGAYKREHLQVRDLRQSLIEEEVAHRTAQ